MKHIPFLKRLSSRQLVSLLRLFCALPLATSAVLHALAVLFPLWYRPLAAFSSSSLFTPFLLPLEPFEYTRSTIAFIASCFLLFTASGVAKGKRQAWLVALLLLPLSLLLHLSQGHPFLSAFPFLLLWSFLLLAMPLFPVGSDPLLLRRGFLLLFLGSLVLLCYALSDLSLLEQQFLLSRFRGSLLHSFLHLLLSLPAPLLIPLTSHAQWFFLSLPWLAALTLFAGLLALLSPVQVRWWLLRQQQRVAHLEQSACSLVGRYGSQTLAFFTLAPQNLRYLNSDLEGLVSYRLAGNVAVVLGDPIAPPHALQQVTRLFLHLCETHDWSPAFFQAHAQHLPLYRALGLHAFKIGEEALLDLQTFSLSGSAMANVRTSARRAEREQIQIEWFEGRLPQTALQRLHALSQAWLEHKAGKNASEMGFSMGRLNELVTIAHRAESVASALEDSLSSPLQIPRFLTALATTPSGELCAFVTFTPIYGQRSLGEDGLFRQQRWGWALDLLRRAPHAPPGVIELLLVRAAERFRARGAHLLSLGLVAQADTLQEMTRQQQQVTGFLSERIRFLDSHRSLFKFKQKFHPRWESRYLVTSTTLHLPKIAFALLRVAS